MYRGKWTLVRWCMSSFKYVPKVREYEKDLVAIPRRIPSIDKLSQSAVDQRPSQFLELLNKSPRKASDKLEEWCEELCVDTLEDFTRVLITKIDYRSLPIKVSEKLSKYGLSERIFTADDVSVDNKDILKVQNILQPLDLLRKARDIDPKLLQELLDKTPNRLDPAIQQLELQWSNQLMSSDKFTNHDGKEFDIINRYISWDEQCRLVAEFLAEFTAKNVHSPFPQSLAGICLKLGLRMTSKMLNSVTNLHGLPRLNHQSPFLWGLMGEDRWGPKKHIIVGAAWLNKVTKVCKFNYERYGLTHIRPAFWKTWFINKTHRRGVIVANNGLLTDIRKSLHNPRNIQGFITPQNLPMLTKPRPWTSNSADHPVAPRVGMNLIASPSNEGGATVRTSLENGASLTQIQGLNRLQSQGWKVNLDILNVIKKTKGAGEKLKPTVAMADALQNRPFYLPMYMDFRGRCYPSAKINLNFMSDDATRALFMFEKSRILGESGLKWMSIHLANMSEQCKSQTYASRIQWVTAHREHVIKSAEDPCSYQWWRQNTTKPYQLLSACIELSKAWSLPDPKLYECCLPVQLDGTSNGLQHLAALACDEKVAPLVNLAQPSNDECGDVYTTVAQNIKSSCTAENLRCEISRKEIKSAVMTYFYGASERTIKNFLEIKKTSEISNHLVEEEPSKKEGCSVSNDKKVSSSHPPSYITYFNDCMRQTFYREQEVQLWLSDCARRVVDSRSPILPFTGASLTWTSPLGLPAVQPYVEKPHNYAIRTPIQSFWLSSPYHLQAIERSKQVKSVTANYIHSLDAAHMLLTSLRMPPDASFAAVHDSFWTHASSIDIMNLTLREAFIEIHQRDLLGELKEEWQARYSSHMSLANVYADSPLYNRIVWERNGISGGEKQDKILETELLAHHEQNPRVDYQKKYWNNVRWKGPQPTLGNPKNHFVKMWVPLQFAPLPEKGCFDLAAVRASEYFFN